MPSFDIAIHGAGLVGQSLALHLVQAGFTVALVSSCSPPNTPNNQLEDVRAFALGHAAKAWLEPIGAWPLGTAVTPVTAMQIQGDAGGALNFATQAKQDALNWIVQVPALAARLCELVANEPRIQTLTTLACVAKLNVICDKHAQVAQNWARTTMPYGQHAIAARLSSDSPHRQTAKQWFNAAGEVLALLPTGGMDGSSYALVWSLASSRAKSLASAAPADFLAQLNAVQPETLRLTSERALWPLSLVTVETWCGQSPQYWVLAGDAAHTIHPLAGQGLNLGFGDAALLSEQITALRNLRGSGLAFAPTDTQLQRCLRSYVRARKAAVARLAGVTDGLHLLYGRQNSMIQALRNTGLNAVNNLAFTKRWLIQQAQS